MPEFNLLMTEAGRTLCGTPWNEYPRPTLRRNSFLNLNGEWEFTVSGSPDVPAAFDRRIRVPFPPESQLSGIGECFPEESYLWYRRTFAAPTMTDGGRVLLHFGAADQTAAVYLNGIHLGTHSGGYEPFTFDVTDALRAENTLTVRVEDHLDSHILPWGKQKHRRGGMWYTPVSGIWQTVWAETVPHEYIRDILTETDGGSVVMHIGGADGGSIGITTPDGVLDIPFTGDKAEFTLDSPRMWSPEDPYLYYAEVRTAHDCVSTYFAVRTLDIKTVGGYPRLCLNGKPYFFHGVLDQGYFPDGIFTPASPDCFDADIRAMKELGFNTLRKHIKVEPELYYYACDRLGMIVFQDMVNNGDYSFLRDTALPTIGVKRLCDRFMHRSAETRREFVRGMEETVRRMKKHPSVCY